MVVELVLVGNSRIVGSGSMHNAGTSILQLPKYTQTRLREWHGEAYDTRDRRKRFLEKGTTYVVPLSYAGSTTLEATAVGGAKSSEQRRSSKIHNSTHPIRKVKKKRETNTKQDLREREAGNNRYCSPY